MYKKRVCNLVAQNIWLRGFLHILFVIAVALLCSFSGNQLRAEERTWISGELPNVQVGEKITSSYFTPGNRDCRKTTLQALMLESANSTSPVESAIDTCVVRNALGEFSGGYISPNTHYAYKTEGGGQDPSILGVPNQALAFWLNPSGGDGTSVYFIDDIRSNGTFYLQNSNLYRGYTYKLKSMPRQPLKDSQGNVLRIREYAFSSNGQWMFAEVLGVGFVRVNTQTRAMTLFSASYFTYGKGFLPMLSMAISNDGNYAITSGQNATEATLYDISGCQSQTTFSISSRTTTGCKSRSIQNHLRSKVGSDYRFLHSMRFSEDGRSIKGAVVRTINGGNQNFKITLSLDTIMPEPEPGYIAMGDSFASGEGDMQGNAQYEEGTDDGSRNKCHLSKQSYPYLISTKLQLSDFHSIACSGAKQEHLLENVQYGNSDDQLSLGKWIPGKKKQLEYLKNLQPAFLTISIGGNDLDFSGIMQDCVAPGTCSYAQDEKTRALLAIKTAKEYDNLRKTYKELVETTRKQTKIYVIGYPQFVKANSIHCGKNVHLNIDERRFITESVTYANQVIKAAAEAEGVKYIDIENSLENRNLCSDVLDKDMAVNGVTEGNDVHIPWYIGGTLGNTFVQGFGAVTGAVLTQTVGIANESFHPNQNGHVLMEQAITAKTGGNPATFSVCPQTGQLICPNGSNKIPLPSSYFGNASTVISAARLPITPEERKILKDSLDETLKVEYALDNLASNSTVTFEIHSTPTLLSAINVGDSGSITGSLTIPENIEPGRHTIHAKGFNIAGEPFDYYQSVYITGPIGDINNNNLPDQYESCGFVPASGIDQDKDEIDDACDGFINEAPPEPQPEPDPLPDPTPLPIINSPQETNNAPIQGSVNKDGLDESSPESQFVGITETASPAVLLQIIQTITSPSSPTQPTEPNLPPSQAVLGQRTETTASVTASPEHTANVTTKVQNHYRKLVVLLIFGVISLVIRAGRAKSIK